MEFAVELRRALRQHVGDERFDLWFREVGIATDGAAVQVYAATSFQLERIRKNFHASIVAAASKLGVANVCVRFQVEPDKSKLEALLSNAAFTNVDSNALSDAPATQLPSPNEVSNTLPNDTESPTVQSSSTAPVRLKASSSPQRGRRFQTLANFVQGACNHIAYTSAMMVAQQPGDVSPLVIHGSTGVGKSHLVEAIWCEAKKRSQRSRVVYLSSEQYTTYFLDALRGQGLPAFRRKCRQADLLIIEDIQFLAGKQATLVEFAYTIDELIRGQRQLILTADRPPSQLTKLGPEIINRLGGGLTCSMKSIDSETMEKISRQWSRARNIQITDRIHRFLAEKMHGDARQLSGVLNRLQATHVATGERITESLAREILFELVPSPTRIIRLQDIRRTICDVFAIEVENLQASNRSRAAATPRMLAMWFARRHTAAGLHEISQFFGRRSHSSAVTAQKTIDAWLSKGAKVEFNGQRCDIRDLVAQVEAELKAG